MARKTKQKITQAPAAKKPPKEDKKASMPDSEETKPMDFGGIPNRNLKKNLGCG